MANQGGTDWKGILVIVAIVAVVAVAGIFVYNQGQENGRAKSLSEVPATTPTGAAPPATIPPAQTGVTPTGLGGASLPIFVADANDPNHAGVNGAKVFRLVSGVPFNVQTTVNGSATIAGLAKGTTETIYVGDDTVAYMTKNVVPIQLGAQEGTMAQANYLADVIGAFGTIDAGTGPVSNGGQVNWTTNTQGTHFERLLNIANTQNNKPLKNVKLYVQSLTPQNPNPFTANPYVKWGNYANPYGTSFKGTDLMSGYAFDSVTVAQGAAQPTLVADINSAVLVNNTAYMVCVDDLAAQTTGEFPGTTGTGATPACYTLMIQK